MDWAGLQAKQLHKAARNTWELPEPPVNVHGKVSTMETLIPFS